MEQEIREICRRKIEEKKAKRPCKKDKWRSKMTAILKTEFIKKNYEELSTRDRNEQKNGKRRIIGRYRKGIKKSFSTMRL